MNRRTLANLLALTAMVSAQTTPPDLRPATSANLSDDTARPARLWRRRRTGRSTRDSLTQEQQARVDDLAAHMRAHERTATRRLSRRQRRRGGQ